METTIMATNLRETIITTIRLIITVIKITMVRDLTTSKETIIRTASMAETEGTTITITNKEGTSRTIERITTAIITTTPIMLINNILTRPSNQKPVQIFLLQLNSWLLNSPSLNPQDLQSFQSLKSKILSITSERKENKAKISLLNS